MRMGMYITLMGAAITLVSNTLLIPKYGMYACAWTTFAAYFSMMVVSYFLGQRYFPVPYNMKKLLSYLGVMVIMFFTQKLVAHFTESVIVRLTSATVLMLTFLRLVVAAEKEELRGMPVIGKYLK
jgi:O-antigen/teichoic acid export membrane protein